MTARVTRGAAAPEYFPPLHEGVEAKRLHGHEAGPTMTFWVGESLYHPGARAQSSPAPAETVYYVLDGELTLAVEGQDDQVLGPGDSAHLSAGTTRALANATGSTARLLVVIAHPDPER